MHLVSLDSILYISVHTKPPSQFFPPPSPPKLRLLQRSEPAVTDEGKRKCKRKPDIAAICGGADPLPNRADEPDLRHAHDGAEYAEKEGGNRGDAGGQEVWRGVNGWIVTRDAALENEVFGEGDAFVDGEPVGLVRVSVGRKWNASGEKTEGSPAGKKKIQVAWVNTYNDQHEIFQYSLEMAVSRDGNSAIHQRADESPEETGHGLGPTAQNLQT